MSAPNKINIRHCSKENCPNFVAYYERVSSKFLITVSLNLVQNTQYSKYSIK